MARRMTVIFDDEELYTAIKVEAARQHRPAKEIVAEALQQWLLELQEDEEDRRIAEERLEEYKREGGIPLERVLKERGLE